MSEIIALPYKPLGPWLLRTVEAFQIAWENYHARRAEFKPHESWVEDIERLAQKESRT